MCTEDVIECRSQILVDGDLRYMWTMSHERRNIRIRFRMKEAVEMNGSDFGFDFNVAFVD